MRLVSTVPTKSGRAASASSGPRPKMKNALAKYRPMRTATQAIQRQNIARLVSSVRSSGLVSGPMCSLRISQRLNMVSKPRQISIATIA